MENPATRQTQRDPQHGGRSDTSAPRRAGLPGVVGYRQTVAAGVGRDLAGGRNLPLLRRLAHQDTRDDASDARRRVRLHNQGTGGCVRCDHRVELPLSFGRVQGGTRARLRQHRRPQAERTGLADLHPVGRAVPRRRCASRRSQHRDRHGRRNWCPLAEHPDVDKIAFTGSTAIGREILRASAGNLKRVSLELGGKSPNIVFPDADLQRAAEVSLRGVFLNSGQMCTAGSRILAHADIRDEFTDALRSAAEAMRLGPRRDPATELGPLISAAQLDRVHRYIQAGLADGARMVTGGDNARLPDRGFSCRPRFSPTLATTC